MGLGPFPVWRKVRIVQTQFVQVYLIRTRAKWDEGGPVPALEKEMWFTHFAGELSLLEDQLSISWERMSSVVVVVFVVGLSDCYWCGCRGRDDWSVGRIGCLNLLPTKSHSRESHFIWCCGEPRRVVRQIVVVCGLWLVVGVS